MLKGERVGLRAITAYDLPQLLEWRNRPDYRRFCREYRELNPELHQKWFEEVVLGDRSSALFAVMELQTGDLLGTCGLSAIDWVNRNAEIDVHIGKDHLRVDEAFAPDACAVLLKYAFEELNLHRVWTEIPENDEAKKRLLPKLGFKFEGTQRETYFTGGQWLNTLSYGILQTEFARP